MGEEVGRRRGDTMVSFSKASSEFAWLPVTIEAVEKTPPREFSLAEFARFLGWEKVESLRSNERFFGDFFSNFKLTERRSFLTPDQRSFDCRRMIGRGIGELLLPTEQNTIEEAT